jgi:hypothetical protein
MIMNDDHYYSSKNLSPSSSSVAMPILKHFGLKHKTCCCGEHQKAVVRKIHLKTYPRFLLNYAISTTTLVILYEI